jgi:hypothetical protein
MGQKDCFLTGVKLMLWCMFADKRTANCTSQRCKTDPICKVNLKRL